MKLPSFFKLKRKQRTLNPSFRSYKSGFKKGKRKPIQSKKTKVHLSSDRLTRRKSLKKNRLLLALKGTLAFGLVMGLAYGLFFTPLFNIEKVKIKGSAETMEEEAMLSEYFQSYLGSNLLLFPSIKHENSLLEQFTYLSELDIRRIPPHTLQVSLAPFPHVANIQVENPDESLSIFIVNNQGFIASMGLSDESLPTLVMDLTGIEEELDINVKILEADMLETLTELNKDFEGKFKINVLETHYLKRAREVHLYTERDFYVWIDLTQDVAGQLAKLKKAMTKLNIYESDIEYIDLRISGQNGEKVIYKLKDQAL